MASLEDLLTDLTKLQTPVDPRVTITAFFNYGETSGAFVDQSGVQPIGFMVWRFDGMQEFEIIDYDSGSTPTVLTFEVSDDNVTYQTVPTVLQGTGFDGSRFQRIYRGNGLGKNYFRVGTPDSVVTNEHIIGQATFYKFTPGRAGNKIIQGFGTVSSNPKTDFNTDNASAALIVTMNAEQQKCLNCINVSVNELRPQLSPVAYPDKPYATKILGRLTIFKNFSQDRQKLFDPYYGNDFVYIGVGNPPYPTAAGNNFDYGIKRDLSRDRVNYDVEEKIFDTWIRSPDNYSFSGFQPISKNDTIDVVFTPLYNLDVGGIYGNNPTYFGNYFGGGNIAEIPNAAPDGDRVVRSLTVLGKYS